MTHSRQLNSSQITNQLIKTIERSASGSERGAVALLLSELSHIGDQEHQALALELLKREELWLPLEVESGLRKLASSKASKADAPKTKYKTTESKRLLKQLEEHLQSLSSLERGDFEQLRASMWISAIERLLKRLKSSKSKDELSDQLEVVCEASVQLQIALERGADYFEAEGISLLAEQLRSVEGGGGEVRVALPAECDDEGWTALRESKLLHDLRGVERLVLDGYGSLSLLESEEIQALDQVQELKLLVLRDDELTRLADSPLFKQVRDGVLGLPVRGALTDTLRGTLKKLKESETLIRIAERSCSSIQSRAGEVVFYERLIPTGSVRVKDHEGEGERWVRVPAHLMMETAVTQALYQEVMAWNPSRYEDPKNPVEQVSWEDGVELSYLLSRRLKLEPAYDLSDDSRVSDSAGFRIPFESEWVWAAQGGMDTDYAGSDQIDDVAVWCDDMTRHVATLQANAYGLYDMCGNVTEWCDYDPHQAVDPSLAVLCGGGYFFGDEEGCMISSREVSSRRDRFGYAGLRLLRPVEPIMSSRSNKIDVAERADEEDVIQPIYSDALLLKKLLKTQVRIAKGSTLRGALARGLSELSYMGYPPLMEASRLLLKEQGLWIHMEIESALKKVCTQRKLTQSSTTSDYLKLEEEHLLKQMRSLLTGLALDRPLKQLDELESFIESLWSATVTHWLDRLDDQNQLNELRRELGLMLEASDKLGQLLEVEPYRFGDEGISLLASLLRRMEHGGGEVVVVLPASYDAEGWEALRESRILHDLRGVDRLVVDGYDILIYIESEEIVGLEEVKELDLRILTNEELRRLPDSPLFKQICAGVADRPPRGQLPHFTLPEEASDELRMVAERCARHFLRRIGYKQNVYESIIPSGVLWIDYEDDRNWGTNRSVEWVKVPSFLMTSETINNEIYYGNGEKDFSPVELTWEEAIKCANRLSNAFCLQKAYIGQALVQSNGFRLPFEAEWEWASRGGDRYGLIEMGGNLPEWCTNDPESPWAYQVGLDRHPTRGGNVDSYLISASHVHSNSSRNEVRLLRLDPSSASDPVYHLGFELSMPNDVDHVLDMLHNIQRSNENLAELQQQLIEHLASSINQRADQALKLKKHEGFTALLELNNKIRDQLSHNQKNQIAVSLRELDGNDYKDFEDYERRCSTAYYHTLKDIKSIEALIEHLRREYWPNRFNERTAELYKQRVQLYRDLLVETERSGIPQDVIRVTCELSNKIRDLGEVYFYSLDDTKEAHDCWIESYEIKNTLINHEGNAADYDYFGIDKDLCRLSASYLKLNNEKESLQAKRDEVSYKQKIYDIAQDSSSGVDLFKSKYDLLQLYTDLKMHEDAILIGLDLINDLKRAGLQDSIDNDKYDLSKTQARTSVNCAHMQDYDEAFKLVAEISSALNGYVLYEAVLRDIAEIAQKNGDLNEALHAQKEHLKAIRQECEGRDSKELCDSLNHVSSLLTQLEHYNEALEFALESVEISKRIDDGITISDALLNLRSIYYSSGDLNKAVTTVKEEIRHQRSLIDVHMHIIDQNDNKWTTAEAESVYWTFRKRIIKTYQEAQDIIRALITLEDPTQPIMIDLIYFNTQFVVQAFSVGGDYVAKNHLEDLIERSICEISEYEAKLKDISLLAEVEVFYYWAMALYKGHHNYTEDAKYYIEKAFALSNDYFDSYTTFEHRSLNSHRAFYNDFDYILILHNDDDVIFDFVLALLNNGLNINVELAVSLAQQVHDQGQAVIGLYPFSEIKRMLDMASHVAKVKNTKKPTFTYIESQVDLNVYSIKTVLIQAIQAAKTGAERGGIAKLLRELSCMGYEPLIKASRSLLLDKTLDLFIHQEIESGLLKASCVSEHKQSSYKEKTLTQNEAQLLEQLSALLQAVKQRPEVSRLHHLDHLRCTLWLEAVIHLIDSLAPSQDPNIFELLSKLYHQLNELTAKGSSQINEVIEVLSERLSCIRQGGSTLTLSLPPESDEVGWEALRVSRLLHDLRGVNHLTLDGYGSLSLLESEEILGLQEVHTLDLLILTDEELARLASSPLFKQVQAGVMSRPVRGRLCERLRKRLQLAGEEVLSIAERCCDRVMSQIDEVIFYERVIPSGSFWLTYDGDRNAEWVKVDAHFMMETQVTQALYETVMGVNPSKANSSVSIGEMLMFANRDRNAMILGAQKPVVMVSWEDGVEFAHQLSEALNLSSDNKDNGEQARFVEVANGFNLPSEVMWEWAARGGQNFPYSGSDQLSEVGWYQDNSGELRDVALLKPNAYGLYDMTGNVYEWCVDAYDSRNTQDKVKRGGSWYMDSSRCEVVSRGRHPLDRGDDKLSLRLSRPLPSSLKKV